jgi:hypothetical protein
MRNCPRCNAERGILIVAEREFQRGYRTSDQIDEEEIDDENIGRALTERLREQIDERERGIVSMDA